MPARRGSAARSERGDRAARQGVDALVHDIAAVPLHLVPDDVVAPRLGDEALPEIAVGDRLLPGAQPAVALPLLPPAVAKAVHDVGAVGVEVDLAAVGNAHERLDGAQQLHALVGGVRLGAGDHALDALVHDDRGEAARAGITAAGAVRIDGDGRRHAGQAITPASRGSGRRTRSASSRWPATSAPGWPAGGW